MSMFSPWYTNLIQFLVTFNLIPHDIPIYVFALEFSLRLRLKADTRETAWGTHVFEADCQGLPLLVKSRIGEPIPTI